MTTTPNFRHDALCRIDVTSGFGTVLTGGMPLLMKTVLGQSSYRILRFKLQDASGNTVTLHDDSLVFILSIQ